MKIKYKSSHTHSSCQAHNLSITTSEAAFMPSTTTKHLVADDRGVVRKALQFLLQTDPSIEVVGEACDGREAVRLTEQLSPDVVVMDITMPQLNGIDAASQIVKRDPNVGVIMLSMHC